jgi:hypothetical protein
VELSVIPFVVTVTVHLYFGIVNDTPPELVDVSVLEAITCPSSPVTTIVVSEGTTVLG